MSYADEGFSVDRTGSPMTQFVMRYHEGLRILDYPLENLASGASTPIEIALIDHWKAPHEKYVLSNEKKIQIAERICAAIIFLGDKSHVVRTLETQAISHSRKMSQ